jgi:hypothetical protein
MSPLASICIISNLFEYTALFRTITSFVQGINKQNGKPPLAITSRVSIEYNTITAAMDVNNGDNSSLYLNAEFSIGNNDSSLQDVYCTDNDVCDDVRKLITTGGQALRWDNSKQKIDCREEIVNYLQISDRIGEQCYACASGDNYHPGFFSSISMNDEVIILTQINRHNSRSIDHKRDYHMRDLKITIPLGAAYEESRLCDFRIGNMMIAFTDQSSEQNKKCGGKILQKIKQEKSEFKPNSGIESAGDEKRTN